MNRPAVPVSSPGHHDAPPIEPRVTELVPGTGLGALPWSLLVAMSVALFFVWGGPLWLAPRTASHVGRFAGSYLAVVPLTGILLVALRRFSWDRAVVTIASVWAVKLVITAVAYQAFARGTATHLVAAVPPAAPAHSAITREYHAAPAGYASGALRGRVSLGGDRAALVMIEAPAPGLAAPAPASAQLSIEHERYADSLLLLRADDDLAIVNHDAVLHTLRLSSGTRTLRNQPLPVKSEADHLSVGEPGVFELRCDLHPSEQATLLVVDHPYATRTAADGSFTLDAVPAGEARLVVIGGGGRTVRGGVRIPAGGALRVVVDGAGVTTLSPDQKEISP